MKSKLSTAFLSKLSTVFLLLAIICYTAGIALSLQQHGSWPIVLVTLLITVPLAWASKRANRR